MNDTLPTTTATWLGDDIAVTPNLPAVVDAPAAAPLPPTHRFVDPMNKGNAWMAIQDQHGVTRYMSDQWKGRVCGFESRELPPLGTIHIAQTHSPAMGMLAFGGGSMMVKRGGPNAYPYHHLVEDYSPAHADIGADPAAQHYLRLREANGDGLPTVLTANILFGSGVIRDVFNNSPRLAELRKAVQDMHKQAQAIDKDLWIDRIVLSLFEGRININPTEVLDHYGNAMRSIRKTVMETTGQGSAPAFVVSQSAGGPGGTKAASILAEARLDIDLWSLGAVVATPKYHLPIEPDTYSTLTQHSARYVSEMEALAVEAVLNGHQWFCPRLTDAKIDASNVITAHFMANNGQTLEFDDPQRHGLLVQVKGQTLPIKAIRIDGRNIRIALTQKPPEGQIQLSYAFGNGDKNDGTLRDKWHQQAAFDPTVTLRRYALSSSVAVTRI